ncbi:DUF6221 family protein [Streptomyces californicus]|uniref:DUF6221 family protein n=1 Tax=Streptomyces californicus TaxID=67351 RepID=UPI003406C267
MSDDHTEQSGSGLPPHDPVAYGEGLARIGLHQSKAIESRTVVYRALAAAGIGHEQADTIVSHVQAGAAGGGRSPSRLQRVAKTSATRTESDREHDLATARRGQANPEPTASTAIRHVSSGTLGGEALLDSHLPMLDLIEQLANDYKAMASSDSRSDGLTYALRVLGQSYAEHPAYQQNWRP